MGDAAGQGTDGLHLLRLLKLSLQFLTLFLRPLALGDVPNDENHPDRLPVSPLNGITFHLYVYDAPLCAEYPVFSEPRGSAPALQSKTGQGTFPVLGNDEIGDQTSDNFLFPCETGHRQAHRRNHQNAPFHVRYCDIVGRGLENGSVALFALS